MSVQLKIGSLEAQAWTGKINLPKPIIEDATGRNILGSMYQMVGFRSGPSQLTAKYYTKIGDDRTAHVLQRAAEALIFTKQTVTAYGIISGSLTEGKDIIGVILGADCSIQRCITDDPAVDAELTIVWNIEFSGFAEAPVTP